MKHLLLGAAVLSMASAAQAQDSYFDGVYVGASAGYVDYYDANTDFSGLETGLVVGMSGVNGDVYGAIEWGFDWSNADADGAALSSDSTSSFSFRAGRMVSSNLVAYGSVGYARTKFSTTGSSQTNGGFLVGGGAEFASPYGMSLRGEAEWRMIDISGNDVDSLGLKVGLLKRY